MYIDGKYYRDSKYKVNTWFERDRAHIELCHADTEETIIEFWDKAVSEAIEDGFLDPKNYKRSLIDYAASLGLVSEDK